MRTILASAAILVLAVSIAEAQEPAAPAREEITDAVLIGTVGSRLGMMFALYGTPQDVWADRGATPEADAVFFHYGPYGFKVRSKQIRVCFFFSGWKQPIRGVKIGASREEVALVLGKPQMTVSDKEGVVTAYGYELKGADMNFFTNFDKDGKVWRVEVSLK